MSSRALRKLQREQEEQRIAQLAQQDEEQASEDEQEVDTKASNTQRSAFELLNQQEESEAEEAQSPLEEDKEISEPDSASIPKSAEAKPSASARGNKKKKKKSKKSAGKQPRETPAKAETPQDVDEIDRALKELSTSTRAGDTTQASSASEVEVDKVLQKALAIDSRNLNAINEMRKLFGTAVLESNQDEEEGAAAGRRRGRGARQLDLGAALSARYSPASGRQGLTGLALKKNPFVPGKEEWPRTSAGGLGMNKGSQSPTGLQVYEYVHNSIYQGVSREYELCVESMQPERMINLLQYNRGSSHGLPPIYGRSLLP